MRTVMKSSHVSRISAGDINTASAGTSESHLSLVKSDGIACSDPLDEDAWDTELVYLTNSQIHSCTGPVAVSFQVKKLLFNRTLRSTSFRVLGHPAPWPF